jgi:hypothetical protein
MFMKNGQIGEHKIRLAVQVVELGSQSLQANPVELGLTRNLVYQGCLMVCPHVVKQTGPIDKKYGHHQENSQ